LLIALPCEFRRLHPVVMTRYFLLGIVVLLTRGAGVALGQTTPPEEPFVKMVNRTFHALVNIETKRGAGSGFFIDTSGHVVTNAHVIDDSGGTITVKTQEGKTLPAKIVGLDETVDLALLQVEPNKDATFIPLEPQSPNMLGQTLVVMGNPHGLGASLSRGILSARHQTGQSDGRTFDNLFQTDAAINPGNSGGPILDIAGNLAGVTQLKIRGAEGLNYAIPAAIVKEKVTEFLAKEKKVK
jgi:serine protease Do